MVSWFESAMEESEKYIEAMSDCIPEIKDKSKPMSNADKIRNMDDAELAEFLEQFEVCSHCEYSDKERCTFENPCVHEFATAMALKWLQSEAE
jgi:glutaredoxin 2